MPIARQRNTFAMPMTGSAIIVFDEVNMAVAVTSLDDIAPNIAEAVKVTFVPAAAIGFVGEIVRPVGVMLRVTLMIAGLEVTDPMRAVIIAIPSATGKTAPPVGVPITEAMVGALEVHMIVMSSFTARLIPSENVPVAEIVVGIVPPTMRVAVTGFSAIDTSVATVEVTVS